MTEEMSMYRKRNLKLITQHEYMEYLAQKNGFTNNTEYQKHRVQIRGYKTNLEYQNILAQQKGFKNRAEREKSRLKKRGFKGNADYLDYLAQSKGLKTGAEYRDSMAQQKGFKNDAEYSTTSRHKAGTQRPLAEAKDSSGYLGVYIAERIIERIFGKGAQRMPYSNIGYDFMCPKGMKIDVKSSVLRLQRTNMKFWSFNIGKNTIPEYFLLLAFDNRTNLEPQQIWLIKGTDETSILHGNKLRILNKKSVLRINNTPEHLALFAKYEQHDKLDKAIVCCETFKEHENQDNGN